MVLHLSAKASRHVRSLAGTKASVRIAFGEGGSSGTRKQEVVLLPANRSKSSRTAAALLGHRTTVAVTQLLTYDDPAKSYTGSLQRGQSIKISRFSRTKTYAYGFAYGKVDKAVWVRTSRLLTGS